MFSYQRLKRTLLASCAACLLTGQALADDAVIGAAGAAAGGDLDDRVDGGALRRHADVGGDDDAVARGVGKRQPRLGGRRELRASEETLHALQRKGRVLCGNR